LTTPVAFGNVNAGYVHAVRRRLIVLASTVLACQLAALAAAPALLSRGSASNAGSELLCECKVEPGAECPMHGGKAHGASGRQSKAHFSPACGDQGLAVLTLLVSGSGILATPSHGIRPATAGFAIAPGADLIFDTTRPPTSPPPRS
jgi:hypothetical protein